MSRCPTARASIVGLMLVGVAALAGAATADVPDAARQRVATVCAACHGANGVSVADHVPHLAGQRAAYLADQLEAFRDGRRKSEIMNVIAPQLSADEIPGLAAYFAALPAASPNGKSAVLDSVGRPPVTLPASFAIGHRRYLVRNMADSRQVAEYFATDIAWAAAAEGRPLPDGSGIYLVTSSARLGADGQPIVGADGFYVPDRPLAYTAMARAAGWGRDIPELLRNENWQYAVFDARGERRPGVNQAECLACHKPRAAQSYLFLHDALTSAARKASAR